MGNKNGVPKLSKATIDKPRSEAEQGSNESPSSPDNSMSGSMFSTKTVPFDVELGSSKGWPRDITVIHYHKAKSTIVLGTGDGAVFSIYDGCQFHWSSSSGSEILEILSIHDERILVALADNSMEVLTLPYLLPMTAQSVPNSWLGPSDGGISSLYCDENYEKKPYVYVGTTEGSLYVIELLPTFRNCDYTITPTDAGISGEMALSFIDVSPKDPRYVALGYDGPYSDAGGVVVFDLVKHKQHRYYNCAAVASLAWHHSGDILFAGTREGDIVCMYAEKHQITRFWSSSHERVMRDSHSVVVHHLTWMVSSTPSSAATTEKNQIAPGILIVQLGTYGKQEETLNTVVTAVAYSGPQVEAKQVWNISPTSAEEVMSILVIPTVDSSTALGWMDSTAPWLRDDESVATPAVLMLVMKADSSWSGQLLRMYRFPSGVLSDWQHESPVLSSTVSSQLLSDLHHPPAPITALSAIPPCADPTSLSAVLITQIQSHTVFISKSIESDTDDSKSSHDSGGWANGTLSTLTTRHASSSEEEKESFHAVLGTGTEAVMQSSRYRALNIVLSGHADGSIVVWGVSMPKVLSRGADKTLNGGSVWTPITSLKCGHAKTEITTLTQDAGTGLLLAADLSGCVVVWETRMKDNRVSQEVKAELIFDERLRFDLEEVISSAIVVTASATIVLGCLSGAVLICSDWNRKVVLPALTVGRAGGNGAVLGLVLKSFWFEGEVVPSIYITWESGHVAVMHLYTRDLLAFYKGPGREGTAHIDISIQRTHSISKFCYVLDENLNPCPDPSNLYIPMVEEPVSQPTGDRVSKSINVKAQLGNVMQTFDNGVKQLQLSQPLDVKKLGTSILNKKSNDSESPQSLSPAIPIPSNAPRYLLQAVGNTVVTFDLSRFAVHIGSGKYSALESHVSTSKTISEHPLIAVQIVMYLEEASRAWADPVPCLVCVDCMANLKIISLREQQIWFSYSILQGIQTVPLSAAIILPTGDLFLEDNGSIIHSVSITSREYIQTKTAPMRASPLVAIPPKSHQLKPSREISAPKVHHHRISIFGGGMDLDRLFSKTREQRQKDELFQKDTEVVEENNTQDRVTKSVMRTKDTMSETKQAFDERGERASRIASKTENFQEAARTYKEQTAAYKERLKRKEKRWGLF